MPYQQFLLGVTNEIKELVFFTEQGLQDALDIGADIDFASLSAEETSVKEKNLPASTVILEPKPIYQPMPKFPIELRGKGISAELLVQFTVTKEGSTKDIKIITTSHKGFNNTSINAIKKWKFEPLNDEVVMQVPLKFIED